MIKKQFNDNERAHRLYTNTPLLRALFTVILPGLLSTLMVGLYIFATQIIIVRLLPLTIDFQTTFGHSEQEIKQLVIDNNGQFISIGDIVKGSMSISSPILTIIGTSPFFLATGAGVLFTQSLGKNNKVKANEVFKTSFWMVVILAITEITLLMLINKPLLNAMSSPMEHSSDTTLSEYYQKVHDLQIDYASIYTMFLIGLLLLTFLVFYFTTLIKSEGRFKIIVIGSVSCNILNIGLAIVFIYVAKVGIAGAGIASLISYIANMTILVFYVKYLIKKNDTWLFFKVILFKNGIKFNLQLILPVIMVGMAAFLIDVSYAVANGFFIPILANTAANPNIFPPAKGEGMYFQTIEGAVMPTLNLIFLTIYGIIDGERLIVSYNYSQGNWKRIRSAYYCTILIAFIYSMVVAIGVVVGLSWYILQLFDIVPEMMVNAQLVFGIQMLMIPIFCAQIAAMSMFISIGDTIRSNIAAIFQDIITFFPVLGIMYGITMATQNIWVLVCTYAINAFISTTLLTIYTIWWLHKRFGHTQIKCTVNAKKQLINVPVTFPKQSYVQRALNALI